MKKTTRPSVDTVQTPTSANYTTFGLNTDIVVSFTCANGIGGSTTFNYKYGSYQCGTVQGRTGDCSFAWIRTENEDTGMIFVEEYYQQYPLAGVARDKRSYLKEKLIGKKTFHFVVRNRTGQLSRDIVLVSKRNDHYDINGYFLKSEISEYAYDTYGNSILIAENVTDNAVNISRVSTFQYRNTLASWYLGEKFYQSVVNIQQSSAGVFKSAVREMFFEWNQANRLMSKQTSDRGDPVGIEETFQYNRFGNVIQNAQRDLITNQIRHRAMTYDSFGLNMIKVNNSLQQQQNYAYDVADNLLEHTDLNGQKTFYKYDMFNRKIQTSYLDKTTSWSYKWDLPQSVPNSVYYITSTIDSTIEETIYYDVFNRQVRKVKQGFNSEPIYEDSAYNQFGSLVQKSLPYKTGRELPKYITFEYDSMMREVRRVENFANGEIITNQFVGLKVFTHFCRIYRAFILSLITKL